MVAPYYLFLPYAQHYDGGFGATADTFKSAGDTLRKRRKKRELFNTHLPAFFLYRHAIELYLKSMIIVLSRCLAKAQKTPFPKIIYIEARGKRKPLTSAHSIGDLYHHLKKLLNDNWTIFKPLCKTDWAQIPIGWENWIKTIEEHDPGGTLLRYPTSSKPEIDSLKDSFKKTDIRTITAKMQPGNPPQVGFLFVGNDDTINDAFLMAETILPELSTALCNTVGALSGAHMGMRIEFGGGY